MGHYPAGVSLQSLYHYAQDFTNKEGDMPLYNWGSKALNQQHYGQDTAPMIDFSAINVPVAMFVANSDELGDPIDAMSTRDKLSPGIMKHYETQAGGHLTFMVGKDTSYITRMIELINQYKS